MSPQEEILLQVKTSLEGSAALTSLLGGTAANTFYLNAEENTGCPYFVYDLTRPKNVDTAVWEGELHVKLWFYATNSSVALQAEELVINMFNNKIISGTAVRACRVWSKSESRNQGIKKDHILNYDAIFIDTVFDLRWTSATRIAASEF